MSNADSDNRTSKSLAKQWQTEYPMFQPEGDFKQMSLVSDSKRLAEIFYETLSWLGHIRPGD